MRIFPVFALIISLLFLGLIDVLTFKGLKRILRNRRSSIYKVAISLFWITILIEISLFIYVIAGYESIRQPDSYHKIFMLTGYTLLTYIPKLIISVFVIIRIMTNGIKSLFNTYLKRKQHDPGRREFLIQTGFVLSSLPFLSIAHGLLIGRTNYTVRRLKLRFKNLPRRFHGIKLVQVSDLHLGSFGNQYDVLKPAIDLINKEEADLFFFTGDLVNNFASETHQWTEILTSIYSKYGKYSVLGNHDYGDYYEWTSENEREKNFNEIVESHKLFNFKLLNNDYSIITLGDEKIAIIGVENWGRKPFPQKGDYKKASAGLEAIPFKILLSHDPTHWDYEILGKTDVALTLSGHTHGMQFGIEYKDFRWSPAKYIYPRWAGLYRENEQVLYVNRGLGYLGYPGRVGIYPEITVIELFTS